MSAVARWCYRRRVIVLLLWVVLLAGLGVLSKTAGTSYSSSFSLPNTQSSEATQLLEKSMPAASGDTDEIVWHVTSGTVRDQAVEARMTATLARVASAAGVGEVVSPYGPTGASMISKNGTTAYARVVFTAAAQSIPKADVSNVISIAESARTSSLDVQLGGSAIESTETGSSGSSELIGVVAALVVMFLVFGAFGAAVLPVITAIAGVATGVLLTGALSHVFSISSTAPILGALVGLGVGVDYALFIVNRHRKGLMSGAPVPESIATALTTSGRAVLFAGSTVIVALLGIFSLGMNFLDGMAIGAVVTVALTVLAAVTLLPALLGLMGKRVLSRRQRRRLARGASSAGMSPKEPMWARYARHLQERPLGRALAALAVAAIVSVPVLSLRLGTSDAGNDPSSTTTRQAYDLLSDGFGPGFNGPLVLVAQVHSDGDRLALTKLTATLKTTSGVAEAEAVPMKSSQTVGEIEVIPTTSPESAQTTNLIHLLRDKVIPGTERGTTLRVLVGGSTATSVDFDSVLSGKLPLFILIIVVLGSLLMMLAFRSLLIPLIGLVMNLLGMGVAFGVDVAVFQWGWGAKLLGTGGAGPIDVWAPVLIIALLFGLSMDYQVFLVSRIHEEWLRTGDNHAAVRTGQGETGRVICAAAVIMFCVFTAFVMIGERTIAEFGLALAVAVLLDVLLLRMNLVPALMHWGGRANWWLPRWLDRVLPHMSVEPEDSVVPAELVESAT